MLELTLPRYVIDKPLASGLTGYYFTVPTQYRKAGCAVPNEALGTDYIKACGEDGEGGTAASLNARIDEWNAARQGLPVTGEKEPTFGSIDWLFKQYKGSDAYLKKVSERSRKDYELTMLLITDIVTKQKDRIGDRKIKSITPLSADKLAAIILKGPNGPRPRQAEKAVKMASKAWRVVHRLHPSEFDKDVPDPWEGVALDRRAKGKKQAVTREEVYAFAWGCIENGQDAALSAAAAAVICFEWLQRPENVIAGYLGWPDYRAREWPNHIRIEHHKTGELVWHPLEDEGVKFYEEAEEVLAKLPRIGIPMILRTSAAWRPNRKMPAQPYAFSGMQKIVQRMRAELGLPSHFTLDACRHGGMTELEEAELTDGQGRALSGHRSQESYQGYAKRTQKRALSATRKRFAHKLATSIQNDGQNGIQNEGANTAPRKQAKVMK